MANVFVTSVGQLFGLGARDSRTLSLWAQVSSHLTMVSSSVPGTALAFSSSGAIGVNGLVERGEGWAMGRQTIESKVNRLEERVGDLEKLPDRVGAVESQIVQLRSEMHDEFSAVRTEMRDEFAAVRREMKHEFAAVRSEMASEFGDVRAEIRAGEGETRRYMRVLHEEVIGRIAAIQEGQPPGSQASRAASNFTANAYLEVRRTGPSSA